MTTDQIELDLCPPAAALIVPFPQSRNVGKARRVAQLLSAKKTDAAKEFYWRQVCDGLAQSLHRAGLGEAQIADQVHGFHDAVSAELNRGDRQRPGGAR